MDAKVLYEVDATKLATDRRFKGQVFDRIVFNFPHAGMPSLPVITTSLCLSFTRII